MLRYAGNLTTVSIGNGACSGGTKACYNLGYMLDDNAAEDPTVLEMVLDENICSGEDSICEKCLYRMDSANLTGSKDILTVSDSGQCPGGPFDYSDAA